jgi:hypothetical protein
MRQAWRQNQKVVVGKTPAVAKSLVEVLQSPTPARELSCCWQDEGLRTRRAKSVLRNALGPELGCCWQDGASAVSHRESSVAAGCVPQRRDASGDTVSNNRDCAPAIFAGCPGIPRGIGVRLRSSSCDNQCGAAAGNPAHRTPPGEAGTLRSGSSSGNSGNAFHPYGRCLITLQRRPGSEI